MQLGSIVQAEQGTAMAGGRRVSMRRSSSVVRWSSAVQTRDTDGRKGVAWS